MSPPVVIEADLAEEAVRRLVGSLPQPAELGEVRIVPLEGVGHPSGSRPATTFVDREGMQYIFKLVDAPAFAAEALAYAVRSDGGRPALPVAWRQLEVPGMGRTWGMLRPLLPASCDRLPSSVAEWNVVQREVMLREHPWEWLLANLDTHVDQYVLVGEARLPVNIDWDHALEDLHIVELTRLTKRRVSIAPVRNLLYAAYANGALALDFEGQAREAARITSGEDEVLRAGVAGYARFLGLDRADRRALETKLLARKRNLRRDFRRLSAALRRERARATGAYGASDPLRRAADRWQELIAGPVFQRLVRPILSIRRRIAGKTAAWYGRGA